ncbi:MAG: hypothetical protein AABX04_01940 [Nanoarchaeota archaeon]
MKVERKYSLWFHGTTRAYLEDQLRENNNVYFGSRGLIYLQENHPHCSIQWAAERSRKYHSEPVLLISSGQILGAEIGEGHRIQIGAMWKELHLGLKKTEFWLYPIPGVLPDSTDPWQYDEQKAEEEIIALLKEQKLFTMPPNFDYSYLFSFKEPVF